MSMFSEETITAGGWKDAVSWCHVRTAPAARVRFASSASRSSEVVDVTKPARLDCRRE